MQNMVSNLEAIRFESSALNGLRGFVAVHIMIYHSLNSSSWGFHTYGQVGCIFLGCFHEQISSFCFVEHFLVGFYHLMEANHS